MKKLSVIIYAILLVCILGLSASAHSGRTDSDGGHNDNINGGYHYHHGYPEHQHPNGKCPYDNNTKTSDNNLDDFKQVFFSIGFGVAIGLSIPFLFGKIIPEKAAIPVWILTSITITILSYFFIEW